MDDDRRRMLINLSYEFTESNWPSFICSSCGIGHHKLTSLSDIESDASRQAQSHEDWDAEWIYGIFTSSTTCQNCKDSVYITGGYRMQEFYDIEQDIEGDIDNHRPTKFEKVYQIRYMTPSVQLLKLPKKCPDTVKEFLSVAAEVLFISPDLAANRIRSSIEALLTDQKIARIGVNKNGKKYQLFANERIIRFSKKNEDVAGLLQAVKWIGNDGTHEAVLSFSDVIDGLDIYALALSLLYEKNSSETRKKAKLINKNKGVKRVRPAF